MTSKYEMGLVMEKMEASLRRVDPKLLDLLVCPLTKTLLRYNAETQELISDHSKLAYPIRDGLPIMLPLEARVLD